MEDRQSPGYRRAVLLVVLFGLISLFSDLVYQAGRSLNGPFLAELGADAVLVGFIAGAAEFLGYALRLLTGRWVDKTGAYWGFTLAGYGLVAAVPLMALAGTWQVAALFIVLERMSKAVRAPAKDTLLSMAAKRMGTGRGFALHKVLDQTGAVLGPLAMSLVLSGALGNSFQGVASYQLAYGLLTVPFLLVLVAAFVGQRRVPDPAALEQELGTPTAPPPDHLGRVFWIYSVFTLLTALGFVSFALLSFHAKTSGLMTDAEIPLWYAAAMGADALAAWVAGRWYDRLGWKVLFAVPLLALPLPFLGFLGGTKAALAGAMVLFGLALGVQETILKAGIADLTPLHKRGSGYGIFNTVNGVGLLVSGVALGALYETSPWALCLVVGAVNLGAAGVLGVLVARKNTKGGGSAA